MTSWKREIFIGEWATSGARFATRREAEAMTRDEIKRWNGGITDSRIIETSDPVNAAWKNKRLVQVTLPS